MSTQEFLTSILGVAVVQDDFGYLSLHVPRNEFADAVDELVNARVLAVLNDGADSDDALAGLGMALAQVYATDDRAQHGTFGVHAVLHDDSGQTWLILSTSLPAEDPSYPALSERVMAAYSYERRMRDLFGIVPTNLPNPERFVHHENLPPDTWPMRQEFHWNTKLPVANEAYVLPKVSGEGVFEIPLGPICGTGFEPGHFRLSVAGERIISLETKLFFSHKGIEKLLEGKTIGEALPIIERISGDAAPSHALAFVQAIETLAGCQVSDRALGLRTLMNELERVTLHIDALATIGSAGAGYSMLATQGFRIKERILQLSEDMFGNRQWRGYILPGGVARDLNANELQKISIVITEAIEEMLDVVNLALQSDGLRDRLETTGVLSKAAALAYGAVGLTARASGLDRDVRRDHVYAAYNRFIPAIHIKANGDVYDRFSLRVDELKVTKALLQDICKTPGEGLFLTPCKLNDGRGIGAVEGARGETLHVVYIKNERITRCAIRDPSVCNWPLLSQITEGDVVSDFPLCLYSLGLSISGNDL